MTSFFVRGEPVPKQSFRVVKRGGKTQGYADPRVTAWQNAIGYEANQHFADPTNEPVEVRLDFYLSNHRVVDIDNLSKCVLDGLKGIAFKDDCQVFKLALVKSVKPENPGVQIYVGGE